MTQTNLQSENALRESLAEFESSITAPVVPGELPDWTEKLKKSWAEASQRIEEQLQVLHPQQFEEISVADTALLQQVELLRTEDEAIASQFAAFNQSIARLTEHLPKLEPHEAKAQPRIQTLADEGVALVARIRKQEVAIQTWFAEAFNRERGGGD